MTHDGATVAGQDRPARNGGLDVLRFAAVFLVLGRHMPDVPAGVSRPVDWFFHVWQRGGWIGVDLFFVISGFLISGLLFKEYENHGRVRVLYFLTRRGFKIYPLFWGLIAVTCIWRWMKGLDVDLQGLFGELTFTQNYVGYLWGHTWSLAVEEHFYLLLSVVFGLWAVSKGKRIDPAGGFIPFLCVSTMVLCLLTRLCVSTQLPYAHMSHLFGTHIRIDSLFAGVLLSWCVRRNGVANIFRSIPTVILLIGALLLYLPAFLYELESTWWMPVLGPVMFYIGGGAMVMAALRYGTLRSVPGKWLAMLGSQSYAIYLWHRPVGLWVMLKCAQVRVLDSFNWLIYILLSIIVGVFMSQYMERPILRLRDRLLPSRSGQMAERIGA